MTKTVVVDAAADREASDAARWYEERRAGLGQELLTELDAALTRISRMPGIGAPAPFVPADIGARRVSLARFPYHVVYLDTATAIVVLAVAHDRRRPGYWLRRDE